MKIGSLGVIYGHILFSLSSTIHPLYLHWGLGLRSGLNPFFLKYKIIIDLRSELNEGQLYIIDWAE
jgi:hypothetical protein